MANVWHNSGRYTVEFAGPPSGQSVSGGIMDDRSVTLRVELVDDQPLVRHALAALIHSFEGIEIVGAATSVDEATRLAEHCKPHIMLMDVLSEGSIFEGGTEIQRRCPNAKLIILDDVPRDANVREVLRLDGASYLTKMQPAAQFEAALRQAARGDRVFTPEIAGRLVLSAEGVRLSGHDKDDPLSKLTRREMEVLVRLAQGYSVKKCAQLLGIGASTVGNHKSRLMKKLDIHKTVELTHFAMREGLIPSGRPDTRPHPFEELN